MIIIIIIIIIIITVIIIMYVYSIYDITRNLQSTSVTQGGTRLCKRVKLG